MKFKILLLSLFVTTSCNLTASFRTGSVNIHNHQHQSYQMRDLTASATPSLALAGGALAGCLFGRYIAAPIAANFSGHAYFGKEEASTGNKIASIAIFGLLGAYIAKQTILS